MGKQWKQWKTLFLGGLQNHFRWWLQLWNEKMFAPWKKIYDQLRKHIKKQRHYFADKSPSNQSYGFSSSHVWMWELNYKENWALKNQCFWTAMLEKTLESHLDGKEIHPVHPKWNQPWIFILRTYAEAEIPILWSPYAKNWLSRKDPDAGKKCRWGKKGMTEDEMVGWHHRLNGHELSILWDFMMDREFWRAIFHGVSKSQTWLSDWTDWLTYICNKIEHSHIWYNCYCSVNKLCLVLCNTVDCSLPDSSAHGISQARILECVAISFSKGYFPTRNQACISCIIR